jgi:hypothetical protein
MVAKQTFQVILNQFSDLQAKFRHYRIIPCAWVICGILFGSVLPDATLADNVRPVYLEVEEQPSGNIRVVWKVPLGQDIPQSLKPTFPDHFRIIPPQRRVKTNDAIVETWDMVVGNSGFAGAQIRLDGLKQTTTDALVRIRLSDGSIHRVVLRPTDTSTTVPDRNKPTYAKENLADPFTHLINKWRYVILFSAAFLLSLFPNARRRGIILCTVALVAGTLCGHAFSRLPLEKNSFHQSMPNEAAAAKILQGLMLNTYRAFMLQDDEDIYDVLSRSVSGDFLSEVFLQNRENMRMDNFEDAMVIIQQLDIKSIESMKRTRDGRINMVANWDVYGSVHHQKHVHYRCNTYKAEVVIEPIDNYWKLVKIQLLDEQRVL